MAATDRARAEAQADAAAAAAEVARARADADAVRADLARLVAANVTAASNAAAASAELARVRAEADAARRENGRCAGRLSEVERENAGYRERAQQLATQRDSLANRLRLAEQKLQTADAKFAADAKRLGEQLNAERDDALQKQAVDHAAAVARAQSETARCAAELQAEKKRTVEQRKNAMIGQDRARLLKTLTDLQKENAALRASNELALAREQKAGKEAKSSAAAVSKLTEQLRVQTENAARLTQERDTATENYRRTARLLTGEQERSQQQLRALKEENTELNARLQAEMKRSEVATARLEKSLDLADQYIRAVSLADLKDEDSPEVQQRKALGVLYSVDADSRGVRGKYGGGASDPQPAGVAPAAPADAVRAGGGYRRPLASRLYRAVR